MELVSGPDDRLWFSGRPLASPGSASLVQMGLDGSVVQVPGVQCSMTNGFGASCSGITGTSLTDLQAHPTAAITFLVVGNSSTIELSLFGIQNPPSIPSIPTLRPEGLLLTALMLGCLGLGYRRCRN